MSDTKQILLKKSTMSSENRIVKWTIPDGFEELPEVVNRNDYTDALSSLEVNEIAKKCLSLSLKEVEKVFDYATQDIPHKLEGIGVDLGAGTALLSAIAVSKHPDIKKIYAVEIVDGYPKKIVPKVAADLLKEDAHKIIPVIGSFDDMELEDNSVDFVIEIHSLHHSHDLNKTLAEVNRVLKPGGLLVCIDRSHPDSLTERDRERLMSRVYSKEFLIKNGYPGDITLTRRENGEHEHRISEWKNYFTTNGFDILSISYMMKPFSFKKFLENIPSYLPPFLVETIFGKDTSRVKRVGFDRELMKLKGKVDGSVVTFKRDYSVFVCSKKIDNLIVEK